MKRKVKLKKKFTVFLFIYFLFLTSYFTMYTLSKYVGKLEKTTSVKVAKWDVEANIPDGDVNLIAGNNVDTYTLAVTSKSEVATNYSIVISDLPIGVQVALDNDDYKTVSSGKVQFNNIGSFPANAENTSKTHILKIKAELYAEEETNEKIKIGVIFTQKKID